MILPVNDVEFGKARNQHAKLVTDIAMKVRDFYDRKETFRIYHGSTNSTRIISWQRDRIVDTSGLTRILRIDQDKKVALVEPNVSMESLVDATLAHGLMPPVVMEFPSITVGGGFAGTAGESSSFRHGFFDNTINSIEIVLADGEIVHASQDERRDLFRGAAGSFGSLGVVTLLEITLIEANPYVELTYSIVGGAAESVCKIEELTKATDVDYIEGILFGVDQGVIISGRLVEHVADGLQCQRYSRAIDPWFYTRTEEILKRGQTGFRESVPIRDYLFRYDRGAFWAGAFAFKYFMTPLNSITRWALDRYMHTSVMYHALHKSGLARQYIVQDIGFPYSKIAEFVKFLDHTCGFYPLWLCPLRIVGEVALHPQFPMDVEKEGTKEGMMLNVGIWGPGSSEYDRFVAVNRDIGRKTCELSGVKCLYAQAYYTEDEFWSIYDREWYNALREKYSATSLPSVFEKVRVDLNLRLGGTENTWSSRAYSRFKEIWPIRGVYGVLHATKGSEYLLVK
ncbi:hypothetical protein LTR66_012900 [Elasticomyces elasticus]|nr:hypothetical protein LTR66_012900 [Elasticomyces elasticus]